MLEKIDYIVHAKWIITCEAGEPILNDHALAVKNGKIHALLPSHTARERYSTVRQYTYASHALLPGFINSHTHLPMSIFRGLADDLPLLEWLNHHIWPAEGKWLDEELVYDATLLALAEVLRSGTTCVNEMYFFMPTIAKAAALSGIRAHIGIHLIDVPTRWSKTITETFEKGMAFYEQYKNHERIVPVMAPHSTYTLSKDQLKQAKQLADQHHLKIHIHLQESAAEVENVYKQHGERPLERLHHLDMINPQLIAVHMTEINDRDFEILQQMKPNIVHCPESNMKLASGICPVDKLLKHGINVALGTDGAASNNDLDMITEMRSAAFLSKISTRHPESLSAETVLQMATINGAKALGIDAMTGSLKVGKAADFIAIDLDALETQPVYHPISQIVYAASRHQVTDVWVAGKQLLKNRQLTTFDEKILLHHVKLWQQKISGVLLNVT